MTLLRIFFGLIIIAAVAFIGIYTRLNIITVAQITFPFLSACLILFATLAIAAISINHENTKWTAISVFLIIIVCVWLCFFSWPIGLATLAVFLSVCLVFITYQDEFDFFASVFGFLIKIGVPLIITLIVIFGFQGGGAPPEVPNVLKVVEYKAVIDQYESDTKEFMLVETWVVSIVEKYDYISDKIDISKPITINLVYVHDHDSANSTCVIEWFSASSLETVSLPLTIMPSENAMFTITRRIPSQSEGFLVRKCEFYPLTIDYEWSQSNDNEENEFLSKLSGARYAEYTYIEAKLPKGSFMNARVDNTITPYGNIDIASWVLPNNIIQQDTGFIFVEPPYHQWKWIFAPFIGVTTFGEAILVILKIVAIFIGGTLLFAFRERILHFFQWIFQRNKAKDKKKIQS